MPSSPPPPPIAEPATRCPDQGSPGYDGLLSLQRYMMTSNRTSRRPIVLCPGQGTTATHTLAGILKFAYGMRVLHYRWSESVEGGAKLDPILRAINAAAPSAGYESINWVELLAPFDAVLDTPIPQMFPYILAAFPNARVLHTVRTSDAWVASRTHHHGKEMAPLGESFAGGRAGVFSPAPKLLQMREVARRSAFFGGVLFTAHNLLVRCLTPPAQYLEIDAFQGAFCVNGFVSHLGKWLDSPCHDPGYTPIGCGPTSPLPPSPPPPSPPSSSAPTSPPNGPPGDAASPCPLDRLATAGCQCAALVCITAMATEDSQRQAIIARAIRAVQGWQIRVDIWLLTNDPGNLTAALEQHNVLAAPGQCGGSRWQAPPPAQTSRTAGRGGHPR